MKVLLDDCLPRKLARELTGHEVKTVPEMGWAAIKNGRLLALAEKQFDVFLTIDGNLSSQQNLARFQLAILVLRAGSNKLADIKPLVPRILAAIPSAKRGEAQFIGS